MFQKETLKILLLFVLHELSICSSSPHKGSVIGPVEAPVKFLPEQSQKRNSPGLGCRTESVNVELQFQENRETDAGHQQLLECVGVARVNKCEGSCLSSVSPSVNHWEGFQRRCSCCKESGLSTREITLRDCYIDSRPVRDYVITKVIAEPLNCACQPCRT